MMKRKLIQLLSMCMCIAMIVGCAPMNDRDLVDNNSTEAIKKKGEWNEEINKLKSYKPADLPEHINIDVSNSILIDADISVSRDLDEYQVLGLKLKLHLFDVDNDLDKVLKLMGNPKVVKREKGESEETLPDEKTKLRSNAAYLNETSFVQIRDSRVMICALDNTPYTVSSGVSGYYNNLFSIPDDIAGTLYKEDKELGFMKVEQAKKDAEKFFEKVGADNICNLKCFSCDKESIQEEVNDSLADMKNAGRDESEIPQIDKVTTKDEGYYIVAQQGYNGVPYLPVQADLSISNTFTIYGTRMELLLTENGIIDATIDDLFQAEEHGQKYEIVSVGDILETFIELHNDETSTVKSIVKNVGLYYLPVLKDKENMCFNAYPVYCVIYDLPSADNAGFVTREFNIFDAVTGERIQ